MVSVAAVSLPPGNVRLLCFTITGPALDSSRMMDTQNLSLYQLNSALVSVDPKACSDSIRFFLASAGVIRGLRGAMKGGSWGTTEAAETLLQCAMMVEEQNQRNGADSASFSDWAFAAESSTGGELSTYERMGIAFEHLGKTVRKLDYGREILGGDWRKRAMDAYEEELLRRPGTWGDEQNDDMMGVQQVDGSYVYTGLSTMLATGVLPHSKATSSHIADDFDPQYKDTPHREFYISACLGAQHGEADSVCRLLGNLPQQILLEIESEVRWGDYSFLHDVLYF